jgi:hypothetical protein
MHDDLTPIELAQRAARGEPVARTRVTQLADPIIRHQTAHFCRRFCYENRFRYRCTLQRPLSGAPSDAPLCEWGNGSYAWMLDDLSKPDRLLRFESQNGAPLEGYFFAIANSLPFYERWKEWRFGKRVHIPTYLHALCEAAAKIFLGLRRGENLESLAQHLNQPVEAVRVCARAIVLELTKRGRLHLSQPDCTVSLSDVGTHPDDDEDASLDWDIPATDESLEQRQEQQRVRDAWRQLDPTEQWVLEAMLVEEQDANDVLQALCKLQLRIDARVSPENTSRQQLYYFRRKTLAKLATLMGME